MAAPRKFNVFVGSETGLFKGINTIANKWDNINQINSASKENQICSLCVDSSDKDHVLFGTRSHQIFSYDSNNDALTHKFQLENCEGNLKSIKVFNQRLITATDKGIVKTWDSSSGKILDEFSTGDNLCFMVQNPESLNIIATGGKETDLKIWNINELGKSVFEAKNVRNDWLNLRVPIWVLGAEFIPESDKIVTCTGHHQVRVYDPKVQRRPVMDMTFDEYPITAISLCPSNESHAIIGNTQGKMATIDFRKGKVVNIFKGFAGSIRDIKCHKKQPLVASCGLDRYVRIHDYQTKELKQKFYLKSRINCLLFMDDDESQLTEELDVDEIPHCTNNNNDTIDDEDIWNKLEVVKVKTKSKRKVETIHDSSQEISQKTLSSKKKKKIK